MKLRASIALIFTLVAVVGVRAKASVNILRTLQEPLYSGRVAGLARTADPVTVGIPLLDDPATGATAVFQVTPTAVGQGCTTAFYIDWDCDGYGPGVRASGAYPVTGLYATVGVVGDRPDADDTSASLHTAASVLAAHDANANSTLDNSELKTFLLQRRGYTVEDVFYISTTGNNGTGAKNNPSLPYASYDGVRASLTPGDAVVLKGGNYTDTYIEASTGLVDGSSGRPIIIMSMPGEQVTITGNAFNTNVIGGGSNTQWNILDGFAVKQKPSQVGLGSGWGCAFASDTIIRNMETTGYNYNQCVNTRNNLTVERSIFHHNREHGHYMGANHVEPSGIVVQDNIYWANGWSPDDGRLGAGYGGYQFNGRCTSCTWRRNISHSNGAWGFSWIQGVHNSTMDSNLSFNNGSYGIILQIYTSSTGCLALGGSNDGICPYDTNNNLFINNTIWVGRNRADGTYGSGIYPEPFHGIGVARNTETCVEGGVSVAAVNCTMEQTFRNNVIVVTGGTAWSFAQSAAVGDTWMENSVFQNNVVYKTSGTTIARKESTNYTFSQFETNFGGTNLNDNPDFVRADTSEYGSMSLFDFRLQTGSPAISFGSSTGATSTDIRGLTRASPPDAGAYAFTIGAGAPPPSAPPPSAPPPSAPPPSASMIVLVSGNNQTGTVGTPLSAPLTVRVSSSGGTPVSGVNVVFAATGGGGTISSTTVATDSSGLASSTLTLGSAAGTNTVSASSGTLAGSPITFTAVGSSSSGGQPITIPFNQWVNVAPKYDGAPNGGFLTPMIYNNIGVYDPGSRRTISFDRWYDPSRGVSIYANALVAYEPASNTATVLKLTNWANTNDAFSALPANTTDPTPIDRHPLGGLALDPNSRAVYLVNGANQNGRAVGNYPDHPNDTWKFSLESRSWSKLADQSTVHPPSDAGNYSGMIYDPPTGKLAYFVSQFPNGTKTWLFDPTTKTWSAVAADATAANVYISTAGIAYDSRRNLVLTYGGGYYAVSAPSPKLWAYSVSQNKWTALANAPVAAAEAEFAYDPVHDIFLALVGRSTLIYNPRTNAWSYLAATIDRGANLSRQNVTYNPAQDVFVFQGGSWDKPVWSLFRYSDAASPALKIPTPAPANLRIIK